MPHFGNFCRCFVPNVNGYANYSLIEAGMALPEGVLGLLYGEEDEVQEIDEAECGPTLRAG